MRRQIVFGQAMCGALSFRWQCEYRGRRDHQVKIRGFRNMNWAKSKPCLACIPLVRQAIAVALHDDRGEQRLVAYVVADGSQPTTNELRQHLREKLPDYMVPSVFMLLYARCR